jgi:hypothetical protein
MNRSRPSLQTSGAEGLAALLEQKLSACRRFLSITDSLQEKITAGDMAEAEKLLAWRQDCIAWIDDLDGRMKALDDGGSRKPHGRSELPDRIRLALSEIREIQEKIFRRDEKMIGTLVAGRKKLQDELSGLASRRQRFQGYRTDSGKGSRFLSVQT